MRAIGISGINCFFDIIKKGIKYITLNCMDQYGCIDTAQTDYEEGSSKELSLSFFPKRFETALFIGLY